MPQRELIHYQGERIDLPERELPGGGWLDWTVTTRTADGTRIPVEQLTVATSSGDAKVFHMSDRGWRITVIPDTPDEPRVRSVRRRAPRRMSDGGEVTLTATALVDGVWLPVARQTVLV